MTVISVADKGPLQPQGCYYATSFDDLNVADFTFEVPTIPNMVPDLCIQACLNLEYTFAAVQVLIIIIVVVV